MRKAIMLLVGVLVLLMTTWCAADAQQSVNYPTKAIKILVPFTAGGGADLMTRAMQPALEGELGVPIAVENKTGANGGIAMATLAQAKPDGYTLIMTSTGPSTIGPNIFDMGYTNKDFAPVAQVSEVPTGLAVRKDSGIRTLVEFIDKAKANPGKLTFGTSGAGSTHHLAMEALSMTVIGKGGMLSHVAFEGGAAAATALLGGHIDAAACILTEILPYAESGNFIILGIASDERSPLAPNIPTFKELGYDVVQSTWYGIAAPARTPEVIVDKLDKTICKVLKHPEVIKRFENIKSPIVYLDHKAFADKWNRMYVSNARLVEELGLKQK